MNASRAPIALILGASRGLGLALVEEYLHRDWHVVATVRSETPAALAALATASQGRLRIEHADIARGSDIDALRRTLDGTAFDLVFVNAGVMTQARDANGATISDEEFAHVMATNVLGPMRVLEAFESLVPRSGTLGVMSSGLGSIENNQDGAWTVYRASKAALNQMLRSFANTRRGDPRAVLAIAPGWVRTDMGGADAALSVEESIPRVVDVIEAHRGKAGAHYVNYQGQTLPW
ncbi:short-subunit dehydrogenase [Luteibacter sp. OK325]|uniref:SDR family NAD(P)-dependent oxidoreductase n=1 Tax=Luteibacter sp. OK325 TaxID=2135670 RepID=UPI000D3C053C|nr:SDR family NAD(P)-dependent oxidoreductase [Luteibacter sp. OK325]PTR32559.1 short-subunit dehydrogenase [Luteibacter sp. OK325]